LHIYVVRLTAEAVARTTDELRVAVCSAYNAGVAVAEIARALEVSRHTIYRMMELS